MKDLGMWVGWFCVVLNLLVLIVMIRNPRRSYKTGHGSFTIPKGTSHVELRMVGGGGGGRGGSATIHGSGIAIGGSGGAGANGEPGKPGEVIIKAYQAGWSCAMCFKQNPVRAHSCIFCGSNAS